MFQTRIRIKINHFFSVFILLTNVRRSSVKQITVVGIHRRNKILERNKKSNQIFILNGKVIWVSISKLI